MRSMRGGWRIGSTWAIALAIVGAGARIAAGGAQDPAADDPSKGTPVAAPAPAAANPLGEGWPVASTPDRLQKVVDLASRYRFSEVHGRADGRSAPGALGAYRVGLLETVKDVIDQPKGTPKRSETSRRSVFVEQAAEQPGLGGLLGSVRLYERFDSKGEDPARMMTAEPMRGLVAQVVPRSGELAAVASLAEGRKLTDYEFEVVTHQAMVAALPMVLPGGSVRIGDSWRVTRRGAQALLGDAGTRGDTLVGTFKELRKEAEGARMVAVLTISGRTLTSIGDTGVNAEIFFTFQPAAPADDPLGRGARGQEGQVDARGGITEIRLASITSGDLQPNSRLRFQSVRELVMGRQLDLGADAPPLPRLGPSPKVDALDPTSNTWLTYVAPGGRFQVEHPQTILPPDRAALVPVEPTLLTLARARREGTDLIQFEYAPRPLGPPDLKGKLDARTSMMKLKVIEGQQEDLPVVDWPDARVTRIEAAVQVPAQGKSAANGPRIHFDAYLIRPARAVGLMAVATTSRDPVAPFRREVEQVLKTVRFDIAAPTISPNPIQPAPTPGG